MAGLQTYGRAVATCDNSAAIWSLVVHLPAAVSGSPSTPSSRLRADASQTHYLVPNGRLERNTTRRVLDRFNAVYNRLL